jgi:nucleoside-diphosphate-sugar epimerase
MRCAALCDPCGGRADEVRRWLTKARARVDPGDTLSSIEAELTDAKCWDAAMEGVRYVLHVASPIHSTMPKDPAELIVPAREGTLNVMRAAARASVRRVVQTSSSTAILYGRDDPNSRRLGWPAGARDQSQVDDRLELRFRGAGVQRVAEHLDEIARN